jgi:hypothetical protein
MLTAAMLAVTPVQAAPVKCAHPMFIDAVVKGTFRERQFATGTFGSGNAMRAYINPLSLTWTLLMILPSGKVCLIAAGYDFDIFPPKPIQPKTESP